jgi:hypothetical protein
MNLTAKQTRTATDTTTNAATTITSHNIGAELHTDDQVCGGQIERQNNDYHHRDQHSVFGIIQPELAHMSSPRCDVPTLHSKK